MNLCTTCALQAIRANMNAGPPCAPEPGQDAVCPRQARNAEDYEFTGDWFSHNISVWERIFAARAWLDSDNKAVHVLEVGSWEGRSAVWFLTRICGHGASTLTAIDCWRGAALYGSNAEVRALAQAGQPDGRACSRGSGRRFPAAAQRFGLDVVRHSSEAVEARFDRNVAASGAGHKVTKLKDSSLRALARLVAEAGNVFDVRPVLAGSLLCVFGKP